MFAKLKHFKLHVKESKCHLLMASVEFLGHMLDADGVHVEKGKIEAVSAWPVPHNLNEVQQFLGLANYYRRFVFRFSELAGPLTRLTRKGVSFEWSEACQTAFDTLKSCLTSAPCLKVFDDMRPIRVVCDASDFCVGSVLEQCVDGQWHPVEFYSKRLN